jgi:ectoine hydroxylase-related dioxygenase (phytanoyl-CoA dioxygenase family)
MVSASDTELFFADGFQSVVPMTTPAELEVLRRAFDELLVGQVAGRLVAGATLCDADQKLERKGRWVFTNPHLSHRAFAGTLYEERALTVARLLFGAGALLVESYAIYKPARFGVSTPWHQDDAYAGGLPLPFERITFWMALQETTVESGCLQFIPGSHRSGRLPHHIAEAADDNGIPVLEVNPGLAPIDRAVACPLPPGGATIHTGRTLHYARPNTSLLPRRAMVLDVAVPTHVRGLLFGDKA